MFNCDIENAQKLMLFTFLFQVNCHGDFRHKKIKMDKTGWGRRQPSTPTTHLGETSEHPTFPGFNSRSSYSHVADDRPKDECQLCVGLFDS